MLLLKKIAMDQNSPVEELEHVAEEPEQKDMGLFDHLNELRTRILISLIAFTIGFAISFFALNITPAFRISSFDLAKTICSGSVAGSIVTLFLKNLK